MFWSTISIRPLDGLLGLFGSRQRWQLNSSTSCLPAVSIVIPGVPCASVDLFSTRDSRCDSKSDQAKVSHQAVTAAVTVLLFLLLHEYFATIRAPHRQCTAPSLCGWRASNRARSECRGPCDRSPSAGRPREEPVAIVSVPHSSGIHSPHSLQDSLH